MPKLNYVNYDFDALLSQLRTIVKQEDVWKDIDIESGTGNFLLELFSYVGNMIMYYIERRAQESYINIAQLKSSIVRLVDLINYRPHRKISAIGDLKFTLPGGFHAYDIYISKGTIVQNSAGTQYVVKDETVLRTGDTTVTVSGIQGEYVIYSFTSTEEANMAFKINDTSIEDTNIQVLVDGVEYTLVDNFVDSTSDSLHCRQVTNLDDTVTIWFGDGTFGKIPALNASITVTAIKTAGLSGNLYSLSVINTIVSNIYDSAGTVANSLLTIENSSLFLGGDDAEDKEEIRKEAPLVFKTGQRAVTRDDFISILENMGGVASAYAWGERDVSSPDVTMFNKINLVCLLEDWINPDTAFKLSIKEALNLKDQLTVWIEFVDADVIETTADVEVKVNSAYQNNVVVTAVSNELDSIFALGTVKLGTAVRYSDMVRALDEVVGVDYVHLTVTFKKVLGTGDGYQIVFSDTVELEPIKPATVEIYLGSSLVATDNGLGVISGTGVTGTVNYSTGVISVTFGTPPGLSVEVSSNYQQDEKGDIIVGKTEIVKLVTKNITVL